MMVCNEPFAEYNLHEQDEEEERESVLINNSKVSEKSECSTQVNMDEQFPKDDLAKLKKRNKKKQQKRRKKQKQKQEERCAKMNLIKIIQQLYDREATFEQYQKQIENCLELLLTGDKFHSFLNHSIKFQVNNIQKQIWDYMQCIIKQNLFQHPEDDQLFYLRMIDKIYHEYQKLSVSSREVQKVINLFMEMSQNPETRTHCQDLDCSTFNYLIQSDESIKSLIRICERRIQTHHELQSQKLRIICSMMSPDDEEFFKQGDEEINEKSTEVEEEEILSKKEKSKKSKKKRTRDYSTDVDDIIRRLNEMNVEEERQKCQVSSAWMQRINQKYGRNNQC